jgi:hypothetical protein
MRLLQEDELRRQALIEEETHRMHERLDAAVEAERVLREQKMAEEAARNHNE